jgi:hypothetical protein
MKLFLATFKIKELPYMQDTRILPALEMRIIMAENGEQADNKLRQAVERDDPYGCSTYVLDLDITQAIE